MIVLRGAAVLPDRLEPDAVLTVHGERITGLASARDARPEVLAAARPVGTMLPGLVDLHCHGGHGRSFPDGDAAGACHAIAAHRRHGTTALLASLVTAPVPDLHRALRALAPLVGTGGLLGVHLEGPYLSTARCGAQDPTAMRDPDPAITESLLAAAPVAAMTYAPERPGSAELATQLVVGGAVPAVGHTEASPEVTRAALGSAAELRGAPVLVTHLFNGMPAWQSRDPGPVAACLAAAARGEAVLELIADGVHLADHTVRAVVELVGPGQVALVTDAMAAAGMPDGAYRLGALGVTVVGGVARTAGGSLAGGTNHLLDTVRHCVRYAGLGLVDAVRCASLTPARLLGLDGDRGRLCVGARADVVCVDDELRPTAVLADGEWLPPAAAPVPG